MLKAYGKSFLVQLDEFCRHMRQHRCQELVLRERQQALGCRDAEHDDIQHLARASRPAKCLTVDKMQRFAAFAR